MRYVFMMIAGIFLVACGGEKVIKDAVAKKQEVDEIAHKVDETEKEVADEVQKIGAIASIIEASGVCYVAKTDTLFVVGDNGFVYEIDKNGLELNKRDYSNLDKHDFEGIAYDEKTDLLYIAIEGVDNILVININLDDLREININRRDSNGQTILAKKGNGLEGISIHDGDVYLSNQSFVRLPSSDPSVLVKLDSIIDDEANIVDVLDAGYINISGMTFYGDELYLVSDTDNLLIKYDVANKKVINDRRVKEIDKSLVDISLEGVAFDNEGYIYFAIDDKVDGRIMRYKF